VALLAPPSPAATAEGLGFRPLPASAGVGVAAGVVSQLAIATRTGDRQLAEVTRALVVSLVDRGVGYLPSARRPVDVLLQELDGIDGEGEGAGGPSTAA
jgi:hypothetical protein